jgi:hypothetical protein
VTVDDAAYLVLINLVSVVKDGNWFGLDNSGWIAVRVAAPLMKFDIFSPDIVENITHHNAPPKLCLTMLSIILILQQIYEEIN